MSEITTTNEVSISSKQKKHSFSTAASSSENRRKSSSEWPEKPAPATPKSQSHRVFTEEDEIHLLKALLRATKSTKLSPPPLSALIGPHFGDGQITDKIRRLRRRYHKLARTKSLIKTPHDRKIYEMARKIWGKKSKDPSPRRDSKSTEEEEDGGFTEVGLGDFPAMMREISRIFPENAVYREGLERLGRAKLRSLNEKWMVQKMEEVGLLAKQAELFYEQTKLELESVLFCS